MSLERIRDLFNSVDVDEMADVPPKEFQKDVLAWLVRLQYLIGRLGQDIEENKDEVNRIIKVLEIMYEHMDGEVLKEIAEQRGKIHLKSGPRQGAAHPFLFLYVIYIVSTQRRGKITFQNLVL